MTTYSGSLLDCYIYAASVGLNVHSHLISCLLPTHPRPPLYSPRSLILIYIPCLPALRTTGACNSTTTSRATGGPRCFHGRCILPDPLMKSSGLPLYSFVEPLTRDV